MSLSEFFKALASLTTTTLKVNELMTTQAELAADLTAVTAKVQKIGDETRLTLVKVEELEAAIAAAGDVSAEVEVALAALKAQVEVVDALVPDVTP